VWRLKPKDLRNIGDDKDDVAVERLMRELAPVVATALPRKPPPPLPYLVHPAHPAPIPAAVAFDMKHIIAISDALSELVEITAEGAFEAPRRTPRAPAAAQQPRAPRVRAPTDQETAFVGVVFEEDRVDWRVLAVEWCGSTWPWRRTRA
jgi:hypothetical protein